MRSWVAATFLRWPRGSWDESAEEAADRTDGGPANVSELIDISVPLRTGIPVWPGSHGYSRRQALSHDAGDGVAVSVVSLDVHTGTHIDAPRHVLPDGATLGDVPLEAMVGPAWVVDVGSAPEVTATLLEEADVPADCRRLLIKSRNSRLWGDATFRDDYLALTVDAARWIVARGISLVGIDYLSVQRFTDGPETHEVLLQAGVVILEGLCLTRADAGGYELMCLPISIPEAEGAPARAVLRRLQR